MSKCITTAINKCQSFWARWCLDWFCCYCATVAVAIDINGKKLWTKTDKTILSTEISLNKLCNFASAQQFSNFKINKNQILNMWVLQTELYAIDVVDDNWYVWQKGASMHKLSAIFIHNNWICIVQCIYVHMCVCVC